MNTHTFPDGSYNPAWPMFSPTPAATLTIGGGNLSSTAITFDNIQISHDGTQWIAEADDTGHTWCGTADSCAGAVLALLADRIGLHAAVTFKPEPEEADCG